MDLDLLLLGKTGMGKSATGNALLGRRAFKSRADMMSVTVKSKKDVAELEDGRKIYIVDTPGVGDTGYSEEEGKSMFITAVREAIAMSPQGYHALLLTMRFGNRLTKEDSDVLKYLRQVFGANFIQKYCVVIMTHGDNFKDDDEIDVPFLEWCRQQGGPFAELVGEVNGRVILFNNRGSEEEKAEQRQELVAMVDKLSLGGRRYTNDKFEKAKNEAEKIAREKRAKVLSNEIKDETSLILADLENIKIKNSFSRSADKKMEALLRLQDRISRQLGRIQQEDITDLLLQVQSIVARAQSKVEQEIQFVALNKELEEKKNAEVERANKRIEELEKIILEHKAQQADAKKDINKLVDEFQTVRDESNRSWAGKIIDGLKWPFKKVASWFSGE